jgi:hypothetical protein
MGNAESTKNFARTMEDVTGEILNVGKIFTPLIPHPAAAAAANLAVDQMKKGSDYRKSVLDGKVKHDGNVGTAIFGKDTSSARELGQQAINHGVQNIQRQMFPGQ